MSSVETEIWNIFTFYTLHGNPLDPDHIRATQFVKLCRDVQILGSTLSEADPPLGEADAQVVFTAEVKRLDKTGLQKMNYNDFLTALMKLAIKVYPRSRTVDDAFQRLLMANILPLASRRCPDDVSMFLENEDVQRLFAYYADALEQIFQFYATSDKRTGKAMAAHAVASGAVSGPYAAAGPLTLSGRSPGRSLRAANSMKEALGYQEFLKFASDFDLSSSVILSTLEIGDIYLSSIKAVEPDDTARKLTFLEFWEALIRCALVAYSKISDSTIIDKIRGLFLYMWRAINRSVPRAFSERRNVSTYAGDLLSGAMLFNKRFTAAWALDGYRDYLSPDAAPLESGKAVLTRLLRKGGPGGESAMVAAMPPSPTTASRALAADAKAAMAGVPFPPTAASTSPATGGSGRFAVPHGDGDGMLPPPPPPAGPPPASVYDGYMPLSSGGGAGGGYDYAAFNGERRAPMDTTTTTTTTRTGVSGASYMVGGSFRYAAPTLGPQATTAADFGY